MSRKLLSRLVVVVLLGLSASTLLSASPSELRLYDLEQRVSSLEHARSQAAGAGALAMLFGAFCALWAQNTRRNALLWFVLGAIFSVITVLVLLYKNSADSLRSSPLPSRGLCPKCRRPLPPDDSTCDCGSYLATAPAE
jgi:multisubunit Na+/H+ antiporter MnhG subunit